MYPFYSPLPPSFLQNAKINWTGPNIGIYYFKYFFSFVKIENKKRACYTAGLKKVERFN
jgi:hypothetical protein